MVLPIIRKNFFITGIMVLFILSSCYYDNVEDLYPQSPDCDTLNITFTSSVLPVIEVNCKSCHSGSAPSGNITLTNYSDISIAAQNGNLVGTISHESGWSPMPKNGNKLDDCTIKKIELWVNSGSPDN
jgi:hypothetical protein